MISFTHNLSDRYISWLVLGLCLGITVWNGFDLWQKYQAGIPAPVTVPGEQFDSFKPHLTPVDTVGYWTDRRGATSNLDKDALLSAQFSLAPTKVLPDSGHYSYQIYDYQNGTVELHKVPTE